MIEELQKIVAETTPKQIGNAIKRNKVLHDWLLQITQFLAGTPSISERVYVAINSIKDNRCLINGNVKVFKNINKGYGFCGPAASCQCAKDSVSDKVRNSKKSLSADEKKLINQKRSETNLERYGVSNSGQTAEARNAHTKFYENQTNVNNQVEKQKNTLLEKYGVTNIAQLDSIREKANSTNLQRYGVKNPMQSQQISEKTVITKKQKYAPYHLAKQNYKRFVQMIRENFGLDAILTEDQYVGVQHRPLITFKCRLCGHTFDKRFDYASLPKCKVCQPTDIAYKSAEELNLLAFIQSQISCHIISGDRSAIYPYEIDIYIPELHLGVEYCGLYWHSELGGKKSWNYHYRKWLSAKDAGIELITIFSDEWLNQRSIVENTLRAKLGTGNRLVGARKCNIELVSREQSIKFYSSYHLLGAPMRLPINIGLFYKNELVALASFIRTTDSAYELIRFASKDFVPGAAGKLLSYFIKTYNPTSIISFSDNRYSNGRLYKKLGFKQIGTVPPMQQYVENYSIKHHKLSLNKKKIKQIYPNIDLSKTEWQLLQDLGFDRIWDCGKIKWEYIC